MKQKENLTQIIKVLLLFILSASTLLAQIPTSGQVVHYPFNGNANDASGNGNNGIIMGGATLANDRFANPNSAYYFDGVDDYIIVDGSAATYIQYSIAIWFKTTTLTWGSSWKAGILFSGNHAGSNRLGKPSIHLEEDNTLRATGGYPGSGSYPEIVSDTGMGNGEWHFAVATFDDSNNSFDFYVDGEFIGSSTSYTAPLYLENQGTTNNMLTLGFRSGNSQHYEGSMDDFRIYNRELTACEIHRLYYEGETDQIFVSADTLLQPDNVTIGVENSDSTQLYQIQNVGTGALFGIPQPGNGDTLSFVNFINTSGTYQVLVTDVLSNCTRIVTPSFIIVMTGQPNVMSFNNDTVFVCSGDSVQLTSSALCANGNSVAFNGTDSRINIPADPVFNFTSGEFTVAAWVYQNSISGRQEIISKQSSNHALYGSYDLYMNNGVPSFTVRHSCCSPWYTYLTGPALSANTWHYVVGVGDTSTQLLKLYVDGVLVDNQSWNGQLYLTSNQPINIGAFNQSGAYYSFLDGYIDEVSLWGRALPESEINSTMFCSSNISSSSNLIAHWNLNEGTGLTAADQSSNNLTGNLIGGLSWNSNTPYSTPISYLWNTNDTTTFLHLNPLVDSLYTVVKTDAQGNIVTETFYVVTNPVPVQTMNVSICNGSSYTFPSGTTLNNITATVSDTSVFQTVMGCDSLMITNLLVNNDSTTLISASSCDSYTAPSGTIWTTTGSYIDTIPSSLGCDSIFNISLTINNSSSSSMSAFSCDSYTGPSGLIWTTTGSYMDTIPNMTGCDSVITISVIINVNTIDTALTLAGTTLTANASGGGVLYQWVDCGNGNAIIPGEINQSFTPIANGNYAVIITDSACSEMSPCQAVTVVGIEKINVLDQINIYPNPSSNFVNITFDRTYSDLEIQLLDVTGKEVYHATINNKKSYKMNLQAYPAGVYFIQFQTESKLVTKKIIKQ